jgi:hypothetical protein
MTEPGEKEEGNNAVAPKPQQTRERLFGKAFGNPTEVKPTRTQLSCWNDWLALEDDFRTFLTTGQAEDPEYAAL